VTENGLAGRIALAGPALQTPSMSAEKAR